MNEKLSPQGKWCRSEIPIYFPRAISIYDSWDSLELLSTLAIFEWCVFARYSQEILEDSWSIRILWDSFLSCIFESSYVRILARNLFVFRNLSGFFLIDAGFPWARFRHFETINVGLLQTLL